MIWPVIDIPEIDVIEFRGDVQIIISSDARSCSQAILNKLHKELGDFQFRTIDEQTKYVFKSMAIQTFGYFIQCGILFYDDVKREYFLEEPKWMD